MSETFFTDIAKNVGELLTIGTTTLTTLITNPYIVLFLSMSILLFGFHIIRSARNMF